MTPGTTAGDEHFMLAFAGPAAPAGLLRRLAAGVIPGLTLFRHTNVAGAAQLRRLTGRLQEATAAALPLLIAIDQEGGQLLGLGEAGAPFPGNMALGAAGDRRLAFEVAQATARELRAVGVNVDYAPVADLATAPGNPSLGIRSFGDDPVAVAGMVAATVAGLQAEGVAATLKHFPGSGEALVDPHHGLPTLAHDRSRLDVAELVPFRAGIAAGAKMVMIGHLALPAITGLADQPATLSPAAVDGLLRTGLGFDGVVITDAMDMGALGRGTGPGAHAAAALQAGCDLLLLTPALEDSADIAGSVADALSQGHLGAARLRTAAARVRRLRTWIAAAPAAGECDPLAHRALARRAAAAALTLVRDQAGLLPLRPGADASILAVMPRPTDLTPADTSRLEAPCLAAALRHHHPRVTEVVTSFPPAPEEIAAVLDAARRHDLVVVGTIAASTSPPQAALVSRLAAERVPLVTVALRTPWDLAAYPGALTHVCTYGLLGPQADALADALFGLIPMTGRLPAAIPGLYATGHRSPP